MKLNKYIAFSILNTCFLSTQLSADILDCLTLTYRGVMENTAVIPTSGEKKLYEDWNGDRWFVKSNGINLVVNEYVASRVYGFVSGTTGITTELFVCGSNTHLATKLLPGFHEFKMSLGFVTEGLRFEESGRESARFHNKLIFGLPEALYGTLVSFDDDVSTGNNFALVELEDEVRVVRYDFDDSLKFYDAFFITDLFIHPSVVAYLNSFGAGKVEGYRQNLLRFLKYWDPSFFWLFDKMPALRSLPLLPSQLRQVHDSVYDRQDELLQLIDEAYDVVAQAISKAQLLKAYNFKKLRAVARSRKIAINPKDAPAKQLADFTKGMLVERLQVLEQVLPVSNRSDL